MTTANLQFPTGKLPWVGILSVRRNFAGDHAYVFEASASPEVEWAMSVDDARSFGRAGYRIARRFQVAARRGTEVEAWRAFSRSEADGKLLVEVGIIDRTAIYLQCFTLPQIKLQSPQAEELIEWLQRLYVDALSIRGDTGPGNSIASRLAGYGQRGGNLLADWHRAIDRRLGLDWE